MDAFILHYPGIKLKWADLVSLFFLFAKLQNIEKNKKMKDIIRQFCISLYVTILVKIVISAINS